MKSSFLIILSLFSFNLIAQSAEIELRVKHLFSNEKDSHLHVEMIITDETGEEEVVSNASLSVTNFAFDGDAGFEPSFFYFQPKEIFILGENPEAERIFCLDVKYENPDDPGYRGFVGTLSFWVKEERAEECLALLTKAGYEKWKITEAVKID